MTASGQRRTPRRIVTIAASTRHAHHHRVHLYLSRLRRRVDGCPSSAAIPRLTEHEVVVDKHAEAVRGVVEGIGEKQAARC